MSRRQIRLEHQLQREISNIIQNKLKDKRLDEDIITVTLVKLSMNLKYAKVYISTLKGSEKSEELVSLLNSARGYIQRLLAKTWELRFLPHIVFFADDSIEHGTKIEEMLFELFPEDDNKNTTNNSGK